MTDEKLTEKFFSLIRAGELDKVSSLVSYDKSLLNGELKSMSPLMEAAYKGHAHMVNYFLEEGCDPNKAGFEGYTALMMACLGGHTGTFKVKYQIGAIANF